MIALDVLNITASVLIEEKHTQLNGLEHKMKEVLMEAMEKTEDIHNCSNVDISIIDTTTGNGALSG